MKSDINITPLIDVLLVLLIIFMVVTPVVPTALDASVPNPPKDKDEPGPAGLVLEVRADDFALNSAPILAEADLGERLRAAFESRRERTLFVRVAQGVPYDRVISALDVATGAGADRIGLMDAATDR